ncbi:MULTISPECIES: methyltransferase domain-containing protein [Gordonibacter]|uniref:Arsenite methyltransferase n=1 Tax=Gordonibacter faecis TaxID=3047475 RepID=A0ABT7DR02_9ACTN|nr:methyltransferase domain-containing protein [Gordonibacter sp. KGMB12511]MDJ1650585.1 methyltransferase domain-containing protein [Gordonibacter sp. KGMB12511]HIW75753.1 methyltransferase domain-containing protein [Candidatus Gordonibacter avicola]
MNIASAKQQIKDAVEAYLERDDAGLPLIAPVNQRPLFLLGAPGIGKTAIMEQVARELGIGIVSYSMTHHTRQSALGLPRIVSREFEGFAYEASEYTMSEIVAALYDYMERTGLRQGILFLDEINCVSETLYPSMLQFLQFKTFGKHRVPDGWVVVCAGNPPEYNRSVHEFDIVTLDRLREIDVEPDYASWKSYATECGLHPAVTTFLETKRECFYKVEAKPGGGKAFVTARGWEDLAHIIAVHEERGKPVNRELVAQFVRDDEIADQFAVYYALFEKYRSDYQVDAILAGEVGEAVKNRARQAPFDERIALVSLVLDVLARECAQVLDREAVVLAVRDELRACKADLVGGASVQDVLVPRIAEREAALARKVASGTAAESVVRTERLVVALLKEFASACTLARTEAGAAAFDTIQQAYKTEVAGLEPAAAAASAKMDNAFTFVDECFGDREMLVFMAELATRRPTTQFVAHYGNESYYAHNQELQVDSARMGLAERASMLEDLNENIKLAEGRTSEARAAVGLSVGMRATAERANGADETALREHYQGKQFEYGFTSVCKMLLPVSELKGKTVLDVCCRRGRGVYKLGAMVGNDGTAWGIDWNAAYIEEAKDGMERAWRESGLARNNMEFRVACPEDLIAAGIGSGTMDVVYVNNVITLFYDQERALAECARVLKPGGLLILETIFADQPRNEDVVTRARALGNSIQAARTKEENYAWLTAAGFDEPSVEDEYEVEASRGYKADHAVAIVEGDEDVHYRAVSLYIRKPQQGGRA